MPALRSYNKVILVGNLTRDPELRYTTSNTPVAVFTVATNRVWVNSKGERKEEASFHRVNVWGKAAESLAKILKKGMKVLVEGLLVYREVRDESGKLVRREARVRAESVVILERKNSQNVSSEEIHAAGGEQKDANIDIEQIAEELEAAESSKSEDKGSDKEASKENGGESNEDNIDESDLPF